MDQFFFFFFYWRLGIDGLSIAPILLTGFVTTLATLAAWPVTRDSLPKPRYHIHLQNRVP